MCTHACVHIDLVGITSVNASLQASMLLSPSLQENIYCHDLTPQSGVSALATKFHVSNHHTLMVAAYTDECSARYRR